MKTIKVLIIHDAAQIRSLLTEAINSLQDTAVVGVAANPGKTREMIKEHSPDVLIIDLEMADMDGVLFLENLMRFHTVPVLMISNLTEKGSLNALRALELGAFDCLSKPKLDSRAGLREYAEEIAVKIRAAFVSRTHLAHQKFAMKELPRSLPNLANPIASTEKIIILGASTGGTEAIKEFLIRLPVDAPAILIAQHMPEAFTKSFAERLDSLCKINVSEAQGNESLKPGHAYIAPGHSHLLLKRKGQSYFTELSRADPVNHHRPSVEVLFRSAAQSAGHNALGVILTGMGKDGAKAMLEMHLAGSYNFAQDEETCVVFGMPREAIAMGAVDEIVPIHDMAHRVMTRLARAEAL